jgi:hypothetical protein
MTDSLKINSPAAAEALIKLAEEQNKAEREAAASKPATSATNIASGASITYRDGAVSERNEKVSRASVPVGQLPEGMCRFADGTVTSIEAARAGRILDQAIEVNERFDKGTPHRTAPQASPQSKAEGAGNQNDKQSARGAPGEGDAVAKAVATLNQATEVLGADTVQALQHDVISSGELPAELPQGVSREGLDVVVAGYTAEANATLSGTGASVETLTGMLTEHELADARMSVFQGNDARLQELGREANKRLQLLPERDPASMKELTAGWPHEVKIVVRGDETWVETPGWKMPWAAAVRAGKVKF